MDDKHCKSQTIKPSIKLKNDMGSEDVHYSTFYEDIPEDFKDIAQKELNETEENKRIGMLKLRDFLKDKGISDVEDYMLITVLRNCKYNIEKSETKLIKYLQTQDMVTKWLQTVELEKLENVLNQMFVGFLPYRDKHGRVIIYSTPYGIGFEPFDMEDVAFCTFCILLYILTFPLTTIVGIAYIGECKTSFLSLLIPVFKAYRHHLPTILSLPFRIAKVEVINENFIIRWGFNLLRPFIPSKVLQRITFHGSDLECLQNFYHSALLPDEFGGTMGPMNPKMFIEDLFNFIKKLKTRNLFLE